MEFISAACSFAFKTIGCLIFMQVNIAIFLPLYLTARHKMVRLIEVMNACLKSCFDDILVKHHSSVSKSI